jgi:hypothetical protein
MKKTNGFFTLQVPDVFTHQARKPDLEFALRFNHLKKAVQIDYIGSFQQPDVAAVTLAFPRNANGNEVILSYRITVKEPPAAHPMRLMRIRSTNRILRRLVDSPAGRVYEHGEPAA